MNSENRTNKPKVMIIALILVNIWSFSDFDMHMNLDISEKRIIVNIVVM